MNLETGERQSTRERIGLLLDRLTPVARALGTEPEIEQARTLLAGNGAERQRDVARRDGMHALVRWLVDETEAPPAP